jgi:tRNA (guanine37-N1)-methyltransferase
MRIEALSVFPAMFEPAMSTSIVGRARAAGLLEFYAHDLRDWTHDRHRSTDDEPYGGGQGQLMKVEPVFEALDDLLGVELQGDGGTAVVFFAPHGTPFKQRLAEELAQEQRIIMVCGRYEGFDERVYERATHIVSLGDFILTGAELAALCVADAVCRLLPGALGDEMSNVDESFGADGLLEYPQYTRPASYRGLAVPEVLLSGNHANIAKWRREQSIIRTARLRPDLLSTAVLAPGEMELALKHKEGEGQ